VSRRNFQPRRLFSFLRARRVNPASRGIIARSETTKESPFVNRGRLLRCARNDRSERTPRTHAIDAFLSVRDLSLFKRENRLECPLADISASISQVSYYDH